MNVERHQVSAVPIGGGERVTGYPVKYGETWQIWVERENGTWNYVIDPATIEPIKAKPIFLPNNGAPDAIHCPNCNYDLMGGMETDAEHDPPYCWECGQALDWPRRH